MLFDRKTQKMHNLGFLMNMFSENRGINVVFDAEMVLIKSR